MPSLTLSEHVAGLHVEGGEESGGPMTCIAMRDPFDVAKPPQPLPEGLDIVRCSRWGRRIKVRDPHDLWRLLRVNRRAGRGDDEEKDGDDESPHPPWRVLAVAAQ